MGKFSPLISHSEWCTAEFSSPAAPITSAHLLRKCWRRWCSRNHLYLPASLKVCVCVCTLKGFSAVSVVVGSHQEHLTLRETWQRCDLGQRSRGWRDARPAPTTRTSINREEVNGWGKGREAAPTLTAFVSAFMCSGYEIQILWLMLLHNTVEQCCYPASPTVCISYQFPPSVEYTQVCITHTKSQLCESPWARLYNPNKLWRVMSGS